MTANALNSEALADPLLTAATPGICRPHIDAQQSQMPGLRLFWPHAGDSKRARIGKSPLRRENIQDAHVKHSHIVQVSHQDVEMHYYLRSSGTAGTRPVLEVPQPWDPAGPNVGHEELFQHYKVLSHASKALAPFGHLSTELGNALIRIAFSSETVLSRAVLQSILAFSALHRYGMYPQAVELKVAGLEALRSGSGIFLGTTEAMQHVAAERHTSHWSG
ncbi:hypothetical protein VTK73DRAFT_3794 [Phialemonium thermophilum]|uniref:Uncharacterized protein n=1 Tax=Phialemonium thermophilum TaxID=223376 RepID=A0ABR3WX65_9PEZI